MPRLKVSNFILRWLLEALKVRGVKLVSSGKLDLYPYFLLCYVNLVYLDQSDPD